MVLDIHVGEKNKTKKNYDPPHDLTIHKIDFKGLSDLNITAESFVSREKKNSIESCGWQRFLRQDTQSTNCQLIFLSKFKIFSFSKIAVSKWKAKPEKKYSSFFYLTNISSMFIKNSYKATVTNNQNSKTGEKHK